MKSINISLVAATLILAACAAAPAVSAQTFYSSLTDFNAAATTGTLYNFNGLTPPNTLTGNPIVLIDPAPGRINFSATGGVNPVVLAISDGGSPIYKLSDGTDSVAAGNPFGSLSTTRISLDNTYTAFAIEYGMSRNITNSYTFALFNGNVPVGNAFARSLIGGDNFFGATSDIAFNNVRVTAAGVPTDNYVVFDNARTGSIVSVVPEASSLALLLPAIAGLGIVLVRRRK